MTTPPSASASLRVLLWDVLMTGRHSGDHLYGVTPLPDDVVRLGIELYLRLSDAVAEGERE